MTVKTGMSIAEVDAQMTHAQLNSLLPLLEGDISKLMAAVQSRVFGALRDGSYTMDLGDNAWREIYAYHQLFRHYKTRAGLKPDGVM